MLIFQPFAIIERGFVFKDKLKFRFLFSGLILDLKQIRAMIGFGFSVSGSGRQKSSGMV